MYLRCVNLLGTVGTFVGLLPGVDLPVPVEAAGVGQHLAALLALDTHFTVVSYLTGPGGCGPPPLLSRFWSVGDGGRLFHPFLQLAQ